VVADISLATGKVLAVEILQHYLPCAQNKLSDMQHTCSDNYNGYSSGMEGKWMGSHRVSDISSISVIGTAEFLKGLKIKPRRATVNIEKLECVCNL
jgi:hypothetical protein